MTLPIILRRYGRRCGLCESLIRLSGFGQCWAAMNTLRRNVFELDLVESLGLADRVVLALSVQVRRAFLLRSACIRKM